MKDMADMADMLDKLTDTFTDILFSGKVFTSVVGKTLLDGEWSLSKLVAWGWARWESVESGESVDKGRLPSRVC